MASAASASVLPTNHADLIHDVSFDFYGRRMATCGGEHVVKIWDLDENGEWEEQAKISEHKGSVWKATWAHPEFGQVLATCSFDRTVKIHEERMLGTKAQWTMVAPLNDSLKSVCDIEFAPKHLGLKLATCSEDGHVRIYEAMDVMNLGSWSLLEDFKAKQDDPKAKGKIKCTCVSWNPSRSHVPMVAVGCSPPPGHELLPTNGVQVWQMQDPRRWTLVKLIEGGRVAGPIHDVAFAPNLGRSYHTLAIASQKGLHIWKITPIPSQDGGAMDEYHVDECFKDDHIKQQVWRVSWNVTGTTLASSGNDGKVRLWRQAQDKLITGQEWDWQCAPDVHGTEPI